MPWRCLMRVASSGMPATKLGEPTGTVYPEKVRVPLVESHANDAQLSESWLAAMSHLPLGENWKWRGVQPRVDSICHGVRPVTVAPSRSMRKDETVSSPRLETRTYCPEGSTQTRPQVLRFRLEWAKGCHRRHHRHRRVPLRLFQPSM